jgi:SAM-dependent methyltransferase
MHPEAMEWVSRFATDSVLQVLDLGGRYVNGTPRGLFPNADWLVLDIEDGSQVDIVADASTWDPGPLSFDLVVCCEVCEHTPKWRAILATGCLALRPGGRLIVTTAGPGRPEHSGHDGMALWPDEYYQNIEPSDLYDALHAAGFTRITVDQAGTDVRAIATRPEEVNRV